MEQRFESIALAAENPEGDRAAIGFRRLVVRSCVPSNWHVSAYQYPKETFNGPLDRPFLISDLTSEQATEDKCLALPRRQR